MITINDTFKKKKIIIISVFVLYWEIVHIPMFSLSSFVKFYNLFMFNFKISIEVLELNICKASKKKYKYGCLNLIKYLNLLFQPSKFLVNY